MTTKSTTSVRSAHALWAGLRDELRARQQARAAYRNLERDLASYRTPSEVNDLLAAIDRQGDDSPQAEQVRAILARNLTDYRRGQRIAS